MGCVNRRDLSVEEMFTEVGELDAVSNFGMLGGALNRLEAEAVDGRFS
jgi:hypothetical protein